MVSIELTREDLKKTPVEREFYGLRKSYYFYQSYISFHLQFFHRKLDQLWTPWDGSLMAQRVDYPTFVMTEELE